MTFYSNLFDDVDSGEAVEAGNVSTIGVLAFQARLKEEKFITIFPSKITKTFSFFSNYHPVIQFYYCACHIFMRA